MQLDEVGNEPFQIIERVRAAAGGGRAALAARESVARRSRTGASRPGGSGARIPRGTPDRRARRTRAALPAADPARRSAARTRARCHSTTASAGPHAGRDRLPPPEPHALVADEPADRAHHVHRQRHPGTARHHPHRSLHPAPQHPEDHLAAVRDGAPISSAIAPHHLGRRGRLRARSRARRPSRGGARSKDHDLLARLRSWLPRSPASETRALDRHHLVGGRGRSPAASNGVGEDRALRTSLAKSSRVTKAIGLPLRSAIRLIALTRPTIRTSAPIGQRAKTWVSAIDRWRRSRSRSADERMIGEIEAEELLLLRATRSCGVPGLGRGQLRGLDAAAPRLAEQGGLARSPARAAARWPAAERLVEAREKARARCPPRRVHRAPAPTRLSSTRRLTSPRSTRRQRS